MEWFSRCYSIQILLALLGMCYGVLARYMCVKKVGVKNDTTYLLTVSEVCPGEAPVPHSQYAHSIEHLVTLKSGYALQADYRLDKVNGLILALKTMEHLLVNVEELNCLTTCLDSFDAGEAVQLQAMVHKLKLPTPNELINLAFRCQQVAVITKFSSPNTIGRRRYISTKQRCHSRYCSCKCFLRLKNHPIFMIIFLHESPKCFRDRCFWSKALTI